MRLLFWAILISIPASAAVIGIAALAYWTVRAPEVKWAGDQRIVFDRDIGFVLRPHAAFEAIGTDVSYRVVADGRGARVSRIGEESPDHPDLLFIGDSFTFGAGVENEETFAVRTGAALGMTETNVALGSYGTTQAVQLLERHAGLRPRYVIYAIIGDTLRRNLAACAPSYYPFCLDYSYVAFDAHGTPWLAPPRSNGVNRMLVHARAQSEGLDPLTWLMHGLDVIRGLVLARMSDLNASDSERQRRALAYLLSRMNADAKEIGAVLIVMYVPYRNPQQAPPLMVDLAARLDFRWLDLTDAFIAARSEALYIADGHPSAAGHALIARKLAALIQRAAGQ
jgi:hypothetical protein